MNKSYLFLTARFPFPVLKGDQVIAYNRIKALSRSGQRVVLVSFFDSQVSSEAIEEVSQYCEVHLVRINKIEQILSVFNTLFKVHLPFQVGIFYSKRFKNILDDLLKLNDFDYVCPVMLRMFPYAEVCTRKSEMKIIFEMIDSLVVNYSTRISSLKFVEKILYKFELSRLKKYEPMLVNKSWKTILVSSKDCGNLDNEKILVMPLGVDVKLFSFSNSHGNRVIAFSGNMGYGPNVEAVNWFLQNCWMDIMAQVEGAIFRIIGGGGSSENVNKWLLYRNVEVAGRVPDMAKALGECVIAVAPMQSGSGMQNKVIEAMSCGLPVVLSTKALGDICAKSHVHLLVADQPLLFVSDVVMLLLNKDIRSQYGLAARELVENSYNNEKVFLYPWVSVV